ncbi:MAG: glycosyltransferase [Acidobacteriota bacterium]
MDTSERIREGESLGAGPIVFIVTHPMTARFLLLDQLLYLQREGFDVRVMTAPGADLEVVREAGIPVSTMPLQREIRPLADLRALAALRRELKAVAPRVVNAGTPKAGLLGMLAARSLAVPHRLYTLRGLRLETTSGLKGRILAAGERLAAHSAQRVICVSHSLRRKAVELGLVSPHKAVVLGEGSSRGVDLDRFSGSTEEADEATAKVRDRLGVPPGTPVIGFVGRFVEDKGIEDLLAAFFEVVLPAAGEARLLLVGDFEPGDPVSERARRRIESDPRVLRPGFVGDAAPYYRLMTALAFPSYREGFPNVPLEAAAAGLPVVGYAATGTVDAVVDGETGILVPPSATAALGEALLAMIQQPARAHRLGAAGRARAAKHFDHRIVRRRWAEEYRRLLAGDEA